MQHKSNQPARKTLPGATMQTSIFEDMSEPEKQVADFLKKLGLFWVYESPIFLYDDKERPRVCTPRLLPAKFRNVHRSLWIRKNIL